MNIICPEHNGSIDVPDKYIIDALNSPQQTSVIICPVCKEQVIIHNVWIGNHPPSFPMKKSLVYKDHKWVYTNNLSI
jgi:hypothetical protein